MGDCRSALLSKVEQRAAHKSPADNVTSRPTFYAGDAGPLPQFGPYQIV